MPFHAPWQTIVTHRLPKRYIIQPKTSPMMKMSPIDSQGSEACSSAQAAEVRSVVPETPSRVCDRAENSWPRKITSSASGAPMAIDGKTSRNSRARWRCRTSPP